jgi:peptidyl-dipeptidase Dcp
VLRDFVEFPSQILENWLLQPQILQRFATHYQTGEPMPQPLIDKILKASRFNQGFATVEYLASALVDLALHESTGLDTLDPEAFEQDVLRQIGMPPAIGPRHRLPHFLHLFDGDSYASAYYVYLWAEVLEADGFAAFMQSGDLFDATLARRLKDHIFTQGNAVPPMQAFEAFLGRPPVCRPCSNSAVWPQHEPFATGHETPPSSAVLGHPLHDRPELAGAGTADAGLGAWRRHGVHD